MLKIITIFCEGIVVPYKKSGVYFFISTNTLLFVCKRHAAGRQDRALDKHLTAHIPYIPLTIAAAFGNTT